MAVKSITDERTGLYYRPHDRCIPPMISINTSNVSQNGDTLLTLVDGLARAADDAHTHTHTQILEIDRLDYVIDQLGSIKQESRTTEG